MMCSVCAERLPPALDRADGGNFWVCTNDSDVAGPGSLLLVGLAGLALAARRRKRKAAELTDYAAPSSGVA
jgi:MYXO-CTERM domain-containing protein